MWLFSSSHGVKLGGNKICLWGCFEGIDFFAWLRNIFEWGFFSSCVEETISFVDSNYCLFEENYERFLATYKSCKTHRLKPREHKLIYIGEVTKHTKTHAIVEELNLSPK